MKNKKKGFTLVELLVVIAILAILVTVSIIGYSAFVKNATKAKAEAELNQIITYVNAEFADDGKWGNLKRENLTRADLEKAINDCKDFDGLQDVIVDDTNGEFTISYTIDRVTVTGTIK